MTLKKEIQEVVSQWITSLDILIIDGFGQKPNEIYYAPFPNEAFEKEMIAAFEKVFPAAFFIHKDWTFLELKVNQQ
jgi:hypothetical protein